MVLAAVLWNGEVMALTDSNGKFVLELGFPIRQPAVTLTIQEANHHPALVNIPFSPTPTKLKVLMEHIEQAREVDSLSDPLTLSFTASNSDRISVALRIQSNSFVRDHSRTKYMSPSRDRGHMLCPLCSAGYSN